MILGKVVGSVVATRKNEKLIGSKFMIVDPIDNMINKGRMVAIDNVGAGIGDIVLIVTGSSARMGFKNQDTPVDALIVGIIDDSIGLGVDE